MLTEILFSKDVFPKGKTLHAIILPENEDYYRFIKEQKEHGLKTIALSSNALLSILCHYFAVKHAEIFEVKLLDPYVLSDKTVADQKHLNIRGFSRKQMLKKYQEQGGICPICGKHYEFKEMAGDHIVPWSNGGHTEYSNLQMLCKHDNEVKSNKLLNN